MKSYECGMHDEVFTFRADSGETYHWNATKIADAFAAGDWARVTQLAKDTQGLRK